MLALFLDAKKITISGIKVFHYFNHIYIFYIYNKKKPKKMDLLEGVFSFSETGIDKICYKHCVVQITNKKIKLRQKNKRRKIMFNK